MRFKLFHGLLLQLAVTDAANIPSDSSNRVSLQRRQRCWVICPYRRLLPITHYVGKGLLALSKNAGGGAFWGHNIREVFVEAPYLQRNWKQVRDMFDKLRNFQPGYPGLNLAKLGSRPILLLPLPRRHFENNSVTLPHARTYYVFSAVLHPVSRS